MGSSQVDGSVSGRKDESNPCSKASYLLKFRTTLPAVSSAEQTDV